MMKRKIVLIIIALCLVVALTAPASEAAGNVCFTAINNALMPLDNSTIPVIIGSLLYIPGAFFSSGQLGVRYLEKDNQVLLYRDLQLLLFDAVRGTVFDQDNNRLSISAVKRNGIVYIPVDQVCGFFGISYNVISTSPAPIVRFISGSPVIPEPSFIELYKNMMQEYYNAYISAGTSPGVTPTAPPTPSVEPTYENVTEYLSFCDLKPQEFKGVLDALGAYQYKCCFFTTCDEIEENANLLRRAVGAGHSIGIWLEEGTFEEYQKASDMLFEVANSITVLVCAGGDAVTKAKEMAAEKSLVFWKVTQTYDEKAGASLSDITKKLSETNGIRESLNFECTDGNVKMLTNLFTYFSMKRYSVKRIVETSAPASAVG